jgi:hypothetical protein
MRNIVTSLGELSGLSLVAIGLGMVSTPLGVISAGVAVFAVAYRLGGDA